MCSTTPKSAKTEYTPEQFAVASMLPEFRQAEPQPQCLGGIKEECRMPHNFGASVKIKKTIQSQIQKKTKSRCCNSIPIFGHPQMRLKSPSEVEEISMKSPFVG